MRWRPYWNLLVHFKISNGSEKTAAMLCQLIQTSQWSPKWFDHMQNENWCTSHILNEIEHIWRLSEFEKIANISKFKNLQLRTFIQEIFTVSTLWYYPVSKPEVCLPQDAMYLTEKHRIPSCNFGQIMAGMPCGPVGVQWSSGGRTCRAKLAQMG